MLAKIVLQNLLLVTLLLLVPVEQVIGAGNIEAPEPGDLNYVVIGAFSYHKNAVRFVAYAKEKALKAEYALNPARQLYYVYVFSSPAIDEAKVEIKKIRAMVEFNDVWIYTGLLTLMEHGKGPVSLKTGHAVKKLAEEPSGAMETSNAQKSDPHSSLIVGPDVKKNIEMPPVKIIEPEEDHYYLYLNTINPKNLKEVKGRVKIIDPERLKEIAEVESHEFVKVPHPNNGTGRIKLATDIFGYKEVQHIIDLGRPVNDTTKKFLEVIGDSIIVDFNLQRFRKGNILVMYNVYFYINAAIMKPESAYELNQLLDMLRENDALNIVINGHTNGNSRGKIIHLNPEEKNYFSLSADHKEMVGSAKKLSLYRASTIQQWLIDHGIRKERMKVKGWGGKKMIYDKHGLQAKKNVRVEIQILED